MTLSPDLMYIRVPTSAWNRQPSSLSTHHPLLSVRLVRLGLSDIWTLSKAWVNILVLLVFWPFKLLVDILALFLGFYLAPGICNRLSAATLAFLATTPLFLFTVLHLVSLWLWFTLGLSSGFLIAGLACLVAHSGGLLVSRSGFPVNLSSFFSFLLFLHYMSSLHCVSSCFRCCIVWFVHYSHRHWLSGAGEL